VLHTDLELNKVPREGPLAAKFWGPLITTSVSELSSYVSEFCKCEVVMRPLLATLILAAVYPRVLSAQDDQVLRARQLLLEASALIKDIPKLQQESAVANVSGQLTRAGDLADALATVHQLKPDRQGLAMGSIAWTLVDKSGDAAQSLSLLRVTNESQDTDVGYEQVAQLLAQKRDFPQALQVAHLIKDRYRLVEALVRLAVERSKAGDLVDTSRALDEALDVAEEETRKDPAHAGTLSQIASAQAETGEMPETSLALRRLYATAYSQNAETSDTNPLRDLAATEARIGNLVDAAEIIPALPRASADFVYMTIAQEIAQHGTLDDALAAVSKISDPGMRNATLREIAIIRRRYTNDALEAIERMDSASRRAEAITAVALEQAQNGDTTAYQTLQHWQFSTGGDFGERGEAREAAVVTYGLLGDFASAERMLATIEEPESRVWPLWNITHFLVSSGYAVEAFELARQEDAAYPKVYALLGTAMGILDRVESESKAHAENR